jgi:phage shock protein PspC (stress-responsive transcriptional regulator)
MARPGSRPHAGVMNTTAAHPEADSNPQTEAPPSAPPGPQAQPQDQPQAQPQTLSRPLQDRMLAGVAAGIARYVGVDVTIVRVVLAVLAVAGGIGLPIYLAGWLLIPDEGAELSIAAEFIAPHQPGRTD